MNQREYNELCVRLEGKLTEFSVDFIDLSLLLSAIRLLADNPDFAEYGIVLRGKLAGIRESILEAHEGLDLTTEQIHDLDNMYASDADEKAYEEWAEGFRDKSHLSIVSIEEVEEGE